MGRFVQLAEDVLARSSCEKSEIGEKRSESEAFHSAQRIIQMRERGEVPNHYTAVTRCSRCGPVPIWQGCPPKVLSCPW